jgi:hypothetical protein
MGWMLVLTEKAMSPPPLLLDDENNPNNAVSYSDEEVDILDGLSGDEDNQSKDKQQNNQPSGTEEQQSSRPVLTPILKMANLPENFWQIIIRFHKKVGSNLPG